MSLSYRFAQKFPICSRFHWLELDDFNWRRTGEWASERVEPQRLVTAMFFDRSTRNEIESAWTVLSLERLWMKHSRRADIKDERQIKSFDSLKNAESEHFNWMDFENSRTVAKCSIETFCAHQKHFCEYSSSCCLWTWTRELQTFQSTSTVRDFCCSPPEWIIYSQKIMFWFMFQFSSIFSFSPSFAEFGIGR